MTWGQTLIQHAAITGPAAAGATAGAAIGASLNRVLDQVGTQAQVAAQVPAPVAVKPGEAPAPARRAEPTAAVAMQRPQKNDFPFGPPPDEPAPAPRGSAGEPAPAAGVPAPQSDRAVSVRPVTGGASPVPLFAVPPSPPPPPPRSKEELLAGLAAVQPGATREQVAERLGVATYKIAYDDGGHLLERLRFRAAGGVDVVVVELNDGVVQSARSLVR